MKKITYLAHKFILTSYLGFNLSGETMGWGGGKS